MILKIVILPQKFLKDFHGLRNIEKISIRFIDILLFKK